MKNLLLTSYHSISDPHEVLRDQSFFKKISLFILRENE